VTAPASADVIVVGAGAGGAAAAYRLALAGRSVLLLEKGQPLPRDGSTLDFRRVVTDGEFLSREPWQDGRGRPLVPEEHFNVGGKTRWYGAAVLRFSPGEFLADAAHGCAGWPIGLDELVPYYEEAERLLEVRTFDAEPALARILGRLAAGPDAWKAEPLPMALSASIGACPLEAAHFDGFASVAGLKADAESAFLARVAALPNFQLVTGAEVAELTTSAGGGDRVDGVRLADGRRYSAAATLLAAGALHSPRLLQRYVEQHGLSGRLPGAAQVGRRLKLHLLTALVAVSPGVKRDLLRKTMLLTHASYPHSSAQPLGFDGELIGSLVPRWVPRLVARQVGARAYGFFLQTEDGSAAGNRVYERQPHGARVLDYDESRTPVAAREHRRFVHGFQRALLRAGMASFSQRIGLNGTAHACGTLPAGDDPASSVVDGSGRVRGIASLYVVDGSALPRSSRVNPSLTIMAWALRVADLVDSSLAGRNRARRLLDAGKLRTEATP
jgi:choline dehydrogenase-like flavoprotein